MVSLLYIWLSVGVGFLILEVLTATFYGLSLSLAAFSVAIYVGITGETSVSLIQAILFAIIGTGWAFLLPRILRPKGEDVPQGMDQYIGKKYHMKKVGTEWKVVIDGVDYRISDDGLDFSENERVEIIAQKNAVFTVKKN